jgi:L-ascorbate metabolism protein UlaG (beta-lactamase superfamily)
LRNPLVELPFSIETIVDVDAVIVTHTHDDHWDEAAIAAIPKTLPVYVQHDADAAAARPGFCDIRLLSEDSAFADVALVKTTSASTAATAPMRCRQWPSAWAKPAAWCCAIRRRRPVAGGDTIWRDEVEADMLQAAP